MGLLSHCVSCGRKLRDAFFCSRCQQAACCWRCLDQHLGEHASAEKPEETEAPPLKSGEDEAPQQPGAVLQPFSFSP